MRSQFATLIAIFLAVSFLGISCDQGTPPSPAIEIVSYSAIPRPFSISTYFLYGQALDHGEQGILDGLKAQGLRLRDAWVPHGFGACAMPIIKQMIVQLEHSDSRIYSAGFVSDSSQIASGVCIETWKHYQFNE